MSFFSLNPQADAAPTTLPQALKDIVHGITKYGLDFCSLQATIQYYYSQGLISTFNAQVLQSRPVQLHYITFCNQSNRTPIPDIASPHCPLSWRRTGLCIHQSISFCYSQYACDLWSSSHFSEKTPYLEQVLHGLKKNNSNLVHTVKDYLLQLT